MPSALAALARSRAARDVGVFLAFCLLTAVMTWPWASNMEDAVADTGDPYMIAWALWWDYHQTFTDPLNLFHANVFYPYRYTLAFSENDYGVALLLFPLFAAGARPLTAHSVATFLGFAFSGYGAFRLARTLTGSRGAAWVAGFVYAFIPFRFESLGHLHYLFAGWMPLLLEALVLFARGRSRRRAAWLGAAFVMNALTCVTWMVLTLAPLALTAAFLVARERTLLRERDFWLRGGVALGAAALLLLPFLLPYYRVSEMYGLKWQAWEFAANSPTPRHWLAASARLKLWAGMGDGMPGGHKLVPGLLPPLLALAALLPWRRGRTVWPGVGAARGAALGVALGVALIWTVWGFLSSLGANFFLNRLMYDYLLPYRSVRVPSRAAMVCYVGLAVLAGFGAARLARLASGRLAPGRGARAYAATLAALVLALAVDLRAFPLDIQSGALAPDAVTLRLKETPMRGGLVELPSDECCSRHRYMLRAADHGKPLVNATASFNSPLGEEIQRLSNASPVTDELLELLERTPASYLVVHNADVPPWRRPDFNSFLARSVSNGRLRFVNRFDGRDDLYAVAKTEPDARAEAPPPPELEIRDWASLVGEDPANLLVGYADWGQALYRLRLVERGRMPRHEEFMRDVAEVGRGLFLADESGGRDFDERLRRLARATAEGTEGRALYGGLDDARFVARLYENAGLEADPAAASALVASLASDAETRAGVLVRIARDPRLVERERKRSLLLLHYFGFLRRNPDDPPDDDLEGFNFWLGELERTGDPSKIALAFRESFEYKRLRGE